MLLCRGAENLPGLDLVALSSWLSGETEGVEVHLVEDLCHRPRAIRSMLQKGGTQRLVLGLCQKSPLKVELQANVRRAGLDPLGVQVVDLGLCSGDGPPARVNARAKVLLAAAVARARVFPGSQPENIKAVLSSQQHVVSRRALFTLPPVLYTAVPTIDRDSCAAKDGCDQCVRACPFSALEQDGDTVVVNRAQCQSCGVCVAVCPQRSVQLPGWSAQELEAQVSSILRAEADTGARAIAFVCQKAQKPAGGSWLPVQVPCTAMVSPEAVLETLAQGADAVAVQPCSDSCPSGLNSVVRSRIEYCQQLLWLLGGASESSRVRLLSGDRDAESAPPLPPALTGGTVRREVKLFGRQVAARAVLELAARYGAPDITLEHAHSPLGLVEIDPAVCTVCGTCASACPTGAISYQHQGYDVGLTFDPSLCVGCGLCASVCPERASGAIAVVRTTDTGRLSAGPQLLVQDEETLCERCGQPVASRRMLKRIAALLGEAYNAPLMERLCKDCRGIWPGA